MNFWACLYQPTSQWKRLPSESAHFLADMGYKWIFGRLAKNFRDKLLELFPKHLSALKGTSSSATVSVVMGKITDNRVKSIMNILFVKVSSAQYLWQPVFVDATFTNEVNATVISWTVTNALQTSRRLPPTVRHIWKKHCKCIEPLCSNM